MKSNVFDSTVVMNRVIRRMLPELLRETARMVSGDLPQSAELLARVLSGLPEFRASGAPNRDFFDRHFGAVRKDLARLDPASPELMSFIGQSFWVLCRLEAGLSRDSSFTHMGGPVFDLIYRLLRVQVTAVRQEAVRRGWTDRRSQAAVAAWVAEQSGAMARLLFA